MAETWPEDEMPGQEEERREEEDTEGSGSEWRFLLGTQREKENIDKEAAEEEEEGEEVEEVKGDEEEDDGIELVGELVVLDA